MIKLLHSCRAILARPMLISIAFLIVTQNASSPNAVGADAASEMPAAREARLQRVARRRAGVAVICHRGAGEFGIENTLQAYEAAFLLGADGIEIDLRRTRDGEIVCFHDDMLDRLLDGYGTVSDLSLDELRQLRFRPEVVPLGLRRGAAPRETHPPTFAEVLALVRRYGGLLQLDVKEPGLEAAILARLEAADAFEHVVWVNETNAATVKRDPRVRELPWKGGLLDNRGDLDPQLVREILRRPGQLVIVDEPRLVLKELGRRGDAVALTAPTDRSDPSDRTRTQARPRVPASSLALLTAEWGDPRDLRDGPERQAERARQIRARATAAEALGECGVVTPELVRTLLGVVRERALHPDFMVSGLDGGAAARALGRLLGYRSEERDPRRRRGSSAFVAEAADALTAAIRRDDAALERLNETWVARGNKPNPRGWWDWRVKLSAVRALGMLGGREARIALMALLDMPAAERDLLAPGLAEEAAEALGRLRGVPIDEALIRLLRHPDRAVRRRALLTCLARPTERLRRAVEREMAWAVDLFGPSASARVADR